MAKTTEIAFYGILLVVIISVFVLLGAISSASDASGFIGKEAMDFSLPTATGETISLSEFDGEKNVLLYFHEGIMCQPCWTQMTDFEKRISEFNNLDVEILTITVDPARETASFVGRNGIRLPVLTDSDKKVSQMYDVLQESMHPGQTPGHTFFLVDKAGTVRWRYSAYKNFQGTMYVDVDFILAEIKRSLYGG